MAVEQTGYVVAKQNGEVKIRVLRESACGGNCSGCHGCPANAIFVTVKDDPEQPFQVGEAVVLQMSSKQFLGGTLGSYGIMTLLILLGAIGGYAMTKQEGASVLGALLGVLMGTLWIKFVFRDHHAVLQIKRQKRQ